MFRIETQASHKLVRIKVWGMLYVSDVAEIYRAEHDAIRAMGCLLGDQVALVDVTECPIQSQQIVEAFQASMDRPGSARRLAMVTRGSLSRMQSRRIAQREDAAMFDTAEEAEAWLTA